MIKNPYITGMSEIIGIFFLFVINYLLQVNNIKNKITSFCIKFTIDKTYCKCYN